MSVVALGAKNNEVHLFSLNHGQIVKTLRGHNGSGAECVDFITTHDGRTGYSASSNGWIFQWDMVSGENVQSWKADDKISRLALNEAKQLLASVDHQIKFWDLSVSNVQNPQPKHLVSGHASRILDLCFQMNHDFLWTAAEQDRFISGWSCTLPTAVNALNAEANIIKISVSSDGKYLLGITEEGLVNIWENPEAKLKTESKKSKKKNRSRKPDCCLSIKSAKETEKLIAIDCAKFIDGNQVLVARGQLRPKFERINVFETDSNKLQSNIVLEREPNSSLLADTNSQSTQNQASQNYDERNATILSQTEFAMAQPSLDEIDNDVENNNLEPTIGEKLKALNVESEKSSSATGAGKRNNLPKADSLQQMLVQALHSNDQHLLEECLEVSDMKIISNTIQRLPTQHVVSFLQQVVHRFQVRPTRGKVLARWIKITLLHHMGYLLSNPQLLNNLAPLYQTVDSRLNNFKKLLRLQGRLDVLEQQIRMRRAIQEELESNQNQNLDVPAVLYDENEEWMEEEDDEDDDENSLESDDMLSGADEKFSDDEENLSMEEDDF